MGVVEGFGGATEVGVGGTVVEVVEVVVVVVVVVVVCGGEVVSGTDVSVVEVRAAWTRGAISSRSTG